MSKKQFVINRLQMEFEASAPGKIILFGEHSVVYPGRSAIATCVSELRVKVGVVRFFLCVRARIRRET